MRRGSRPFRAGHGHGPGLHAFCALCLFLAVTGALMVAPSPARSATRTELRQKLGTTQQRLDQTRAAIRQAEEARRGALKDIAVLDRQIDELEVQLESLTAERDEAVVALERTQRRLEELTTEVEQKRAQLAKAEADLASQQVVMNERAANLYKNGRVGYVEVLLQTSRLDELLNRLDLLERVAQQDADLLGQIEALRARVTTEKAALEETQAAVATAEREQRRQTERIRSAVAGREATVEQLAGAKARKQAVVTKAEKDVAEWERQENELLGESDAIATQLRSGSPSRGGSTSVRPAASGRFARPVDGRVTSPFGYRVHPIFKVRKLHTGVDFGAPSGAPIYASAGGSVVFAGWRGGYGRTIIVDHGGGVSTLYAHQSSFAVSQGQSVRQGQVIGRVGSTGYSTGPHLHFEVRVNGSPVDPMRYL